MQWYEKFKVGQKVRVVKIIGNWRYEAGSICWNRQYMDKTLNKIYEIVEIKRRSGYKLHTQIPTNSNYDSHLYDYWYPVEALAYVEGQQLLFSFYHSIKG